MTRVRRQLKIRGRMLVVTLFVCMPGFADQAPDRIDSLSRVGGTIQQLSLLPEPATSPYPDCIRTALFEISVVHEGPAEEGPAVIAFWGFRNRVIDPGLHHAIGDSLTLRVLPFLDVPEIQEVQRADTVKGLGLPMYWVVEPAATAASHDPVCRDRAPAACDPTASGRWPVAVEASRPVVAKRREAAISADRVRLQSLLEQHGGTWANWHGGLAFIRKALARAPEGEQEQWQQLPLPFCRADVFSLTPESLGGRLRARAQVAMLMDLHRRLTPRGIDLIVVPFPFREEIGLWQWAAEVPEGPVPVPYRMMILHALLEAGVEVLDLLPCFSAQWRSFHPMYYQGCNDHPADCALRLAAQCIAERLGRYRSRSLMSVEEAALVRRNVPLGPSEAGRSATQVLDADGRFVAELADDSPVLVLGDSYTRYPYKSEFGSVESADLAAQLSYELGFPVAHYTVSSAAPNIGRILARAPHLLTGRTICVLVFSPYYPLLRTERHDWSWEIVDF